MTDKNSAGTYRTLSKFCRSLFETSNLIGTDFENISVDGSGAAIRAGRKGACTSSSRVSWHAFGKTGKDAHDALDVLLSKKPDPASEG